jgi:hypothetical protein
MNRKRFFLSETDVGITPGRVKRSRSIDGLIATALLLTFLFTGCVSTQLAKATWLPPEKKGSVRIIGVVSGGAPQVDLQGYKKDQQAEVGGGTVGGGLIGFGIAGGCAVYVAGVMGALFSPLGKDASSGAANATLAYVFPGVLACTAIGAVIGGVATAAKSVPAKRAEEIEAAVLPALSDFPFQERMVEQILAAGTRDTKYNFLDLHRTDAQDYLSEEVDAMLKLSVLNVGLRKLGNSLQLSAAVRVQLIENDTGTSLAEHTFSHVWRTFARNTPEAGDEPLSREEIDGCLHVLSEDIVDTLCLMEDFPSRFWDGVLVEPGMFSDALQPKNLKAESNLFGVWKSGTVDSLRPRLEWVPFPRPQYGETSTKGRLNEIGQVSYDLRIWRLAEEMHHPSELVYERKGLVDPWHTVEQPLNYGKTYYWAVRARFVRDGHAAVTQWTTWPGYLPLISEEGTTTGKVSGRYKFSTPALPAELKFYRPGSTR